VFGEETRSITMVKAESIHTRIDPKKPLKAHGWLLRIPSLFAVSPEIHNNNNNWSFSLHCILEKSIQLSVSLL
jgi:hypothetical protein